MTIHDLQPSVLIENIQSAFADSEYPGDARAFTAHGGGEISNEFHRLRRRRWQDLDLEELPGMAMDLMWLSPAGLSYYLPAFLAAAVCFPEIQSSAIVGFLCPPSGHDRGGSQEFRQFLEDLTSQQRHVIRECLDHLRVPLLGPFACWSNQ